MRERAREMRREGKPLSQIAEACGVTHVCVSKWCRDLPEHRAAASRNAQATYEGRRIYPRGTEKFAAKLARLGIAPAERLRLARQVAAADRDAGGRA